MNKLFVAAAMVACGVAQMSAEINPVKSPLKVSEGTLETFAIYSPELERDVQIDVLLPEGYSADVKHPVVYMHDGQNLFDATAVWNGQAWEMDEAVGRYAKAVGDAPAPIIVGVYSTPDTRVGDLMPTEIIEMIPRDLIAGYVEEMCPGGVKGDKYVDFIAGTLKNEIDGHYATDASVEATSVMGSSMGGLASFYAMCRHPEVFGGAACLSTHLTGTLGANEIFPTANAAYILSHLPVDDTHRIYFDCGDQTVDEYYVPYYDRLIDMISQMGLAPANFLHGFYPGASHSESSWAERVDTPLRFLLRK